jgi:hypothetical protein
MTPTTLRPASKSRLAIAAAAALLSAAPAMAQTGADLLLKPYKEGTNYELQFDAGWAFQSETDNGPGYDISIGYLGGQGRAAFLKGNQARPLAGFEIHHLFLDTNDPALPDNLGDYSAGVGFGIFSQDGWIGGLSLGVGYAAAQPFEDGDGYYGKATLVVGKEDAWRGWTIGVALDYDGNRTAFPDVPLPGFVMRKKFDQYHATVSLGFPVTGVIWQPNDQWDIEVNYLFPDDANAKVTYYVTPQFGVYGSVAQSSDAFKYDLGDNNLDRLIYTQRRAELGVDWKASESVSVLVAGGYSFGRRFTYGFDTRDDVKVADLDDGPYARLSVQITR